MQMEPWDGPALLAFSDGHYIGAILDRNGLRPARYCVTADDHIYLASEVGIIDLPAECVVKRVGLFFNTTFKFNLQKFKKYFYNKI